MSVGPQTRRRARSFVAVAVAVALGACSGSDGGAAPPSTDRTAVTTTPTTSTTSTTIGVDRLPDAVEPTSVPEGWRALRAPGIGVGVAVPDGWTISDLQGDDLSADQLEAAADDPQLSGLLADDGALAGAARPLVAIGPTGDQGTSLVTLLQLLVATDLPDELLPTVRDQVEGLGATDVAVERVVVPGLASGRRAVQVRAVLSVKGRAQRLAVTIVPATPGIAVVTARGTAAEVDAITASLAAS